MTTTSNKESKETLESVFVGLPNGCMLKNPNNFNINYTCTYKENSRKGFKTSGDTPSQAVIKMAEQLALRGLYE